MLPVSLLGQLCRSWHSDYHLCGTVPPSNHSKVAPNWPVQISESWGILRLEETRVHLVYSAAAFITGEHTMAVAFTLYSPVFA